MINNKVKFFVLGMASMLAWQERGQISTQFNLATQCVSQVARGKACSPTQKHAFVELPLMLTTDLCGPLKPNCQAFFRTGLRG